MASTSEEVPEEISERILRRILLFAGVPTFTGFVSLPLFWYLKVRTAALKPPVWLLSSWHMKQKVHASGVCCIPGQSGNVRLGCLVSTFAQQGSISLALL